MIDSRLEKTVEEFGGLSDAELSDRKKQHANKLNGARNVDLRAYKASQQEDDERSLLERSVDTVKHAFGFTPERKLDKMIARASNQLGVYSRHIDRLEDRVSGQVEQLKELGEENISHRAYFSLVTEQYQRQQVTLDRLEAELEQTGDSLTQESHTLRERVMSAQTELRSLEHEANEAMHHYVSSGRRYEALSDAHRSTAQKLGEFNRQKTRIGMLVDNWSLQREISVDGKTPSLVSQYERLGMLAQEINEHFEKHFSRKTASGIDTTYGAAVGDEKEDPLVERWLHLREQ